MPSVAEIIAHSPLACPEWRLCNIHTIRDADGSLVRFNPNAAQREFYNDYWYCNDILKARKLGFSTIIEVKFADDLIFSSTGLRAGIVDYTIDDAESKLAMMRLTYDLLDDPAIHPDTWQIGAALKAAVPLLTDAKRELAWGNGSTARASTSMRGDTPQRLHISEMGKTAIWAPVKAREIINGAFNSMTPGNIRNMESTHEGGKVGEHYRLLNLSMKADRNNLSPIQSRFHFFAWWRDTRYQVDPKGHTLRPEILRYFQELAANHGIVLTPGQMVWYDMKHQEQGHGMKKEFPSHAGEAFEAIQNNAIYGEEMATLRANGRIRDFGMEAGAPLYTFWDIGLSDFTAVWLIQHIGPCFLVLDWFETEGRAAAAMADAMLLLERKWRRPITAHYLPHDADTRDRGTGLTYRQQLHAAGLQNTRVVPRTPDVWIGIGLARQILPKCWFHKTHCDTPRNRDGSPHAPGDTYNEEFPSGIACLEGYARDTSASAAARLREMPKHDLFSHSSDAFRTFAEAHARGLINPTEDGHSRGGPIATGGPGRRR